MIYVFTLATGNYVKYIKEFFIPSFKNLMKGEEKTLVIFSNLLREYDGIKDDCINIKVEHIYNLYFYDLVLNKYNFINQYIIKNNIKDDDIIFYFDVDTIFYDNEICKNYIKEVISDNKVHFSINPHYFYFKFFNENNEEERKTTYNPLEKITFNKDDISAALLFGYVSPFKKFYDKFYNIILKVFKSIKTTGELILPMFPEEFYINYINNTTDDIINGTELYIIPNVHIYNTTGIPTADIHCINIGFADDHRDILIDKSEDYHLLCNQKFLYNYKLLNKDRY